MRRVVAEGGGSVRCDGFSRRWEEEERDIGRILYHWVVSGHWPLLQPQVGMLTRSEATVPKLQHV